MQWEGVAKIEVEIGCSVYIGSAMVYFLAAVIKNIKIIRKSEG